jgi:hypothetical protein
MECVEHGMDHLPIPTKHEEGGKGRGGVNERVQSRHRDLDRDGLRWQIVSRSGPADIKRRVITGIISCIMNPWSSPLHNTPP